MQEYVNQGVFELFGQPESDAHLTLTMDRKNDLVVDESEFVVAVTLFRLENIGVDLPLCVVKVTQENWKRAE